MQTTLAINNSLLNKFVKMRGSVPLHQARAVANRLISVLKSHDQLGEEIYLSEENMARPRRRPEPPHAPAREKALVAVGMEWVAVGTSAEIKRNITAISALLETIIEQTSRSNAPPDEQILSELDRQQLIVILETALNVLKSPLAEKGLLNTAKDVLRRGAENAAEKGVQEGLGRLMAIAGSRILELIGMLFR